MQVSDVSGASSSPLRTEANSIVAGGMPGVGTSVAASSSSAAPVQPKQTAAVDAAKRAKAVLPKPLPGKGRGRGAAKKSALPQPRLPPPQASIPEPQGRPSRAKKGHKAHKARPVTTGPDDSAEESSSTPEVGAPAVSVLDSDGGEISEDHPSPGDLAAVGSSPSPPRRVSERLRERRAHVAMAAAGQGPAVNKPKPSSAPHLPVRTATLGRGRGRPGRKPGRGQQTRKPTDITPAAKEVSDDDDDLPLNALGVIPKPSSSVETSTKQIRPVEEKADSGEVAPVETRLDPDPVPASNGANACVEEIPPRDPCETGQFGQPGASATGDQGGPSETVSIAAPNALLLQQANHEPESRRSPPISRAAAQKTGVAKGPDIAPATEGKGQARAGLKHPQSEPLPRKVNVLACGDLRGRLDYLAEALEDLASQGVKVDFVLAAGRCFPGTDLEENMVFTTYEGHPPNSKLKVPVYFVDMASEKRIRAAARCPSTRPKALAEVDGKPMLTFLGACGVVDIEGVCIAFLSGSYDEHVSNQVWEVGRFVGAKYTANAISEVLQQRESSSAKVVDILLTSEWTDKYWSTALQGEALQVVQQKFASPAVRELFEKLRPRYHICASADTYKYRKAEQGPRNFVCTTVGLANASAACDMTTDDRKWYKLLSLRPGEAFEPGKLAGGEAKKVVTASRARRPVQEKIVIPAGEPEMRVRGASQVPAPELIQESPLKKRRNDDTSELPAQDLLSSPGPMQPHKRQRRSIPEKEAPTPVMRQARGVHRDEDKITSPHRDESMGTDTPSRGGLSLTPQLHGVPSPPLPAIHSLEPLADSANGAQPLTPVVAAAAPAHTAPVPFTCGSAPPSAITPITNTAGLQTPIVAASTPMRPGAAETTPEVAAATREGMQTPTAGEARLDDSAAGRDTLLQRASELIAQGLKLGSATQETFVDPPQAPQPKARAPVVLPVVYDSLADQDETSPADAAQEPPPGWEIRWSRTHGREYYYHLETGRSEWLCPIDRDEL